MANRTWLLPALAGLILVPLHTASTVPACCPAPPSNRPVVNADQTVLIVWDAATKTEHFIRKASFKSDADDFGFLVPTPAQPELSESGNAAFPFLQKLTEPETKKVKAPSGGIGCGCGSAGPAPGSLAPPVRVLQEKLVAGFKATVLETTSAKALVGWLRDNGYAFSPQVEAWAEPYVRDGWKITALKVAREKGDRANQDVAASALRMSFKTDRPLFPYREPDSRASSHALGVGSRLLRIYFVADARYQGELTPQVAWTGRVAWANKIGPADRAKALELLNLPGDTGPAEWWLTEFEDPWPYDRVAPADVYFARDRRQDTVARPPIIQYVYAPWPTDVTAYALAAVVVVPPLLRRFRHGRGKRT